MGAGFNNLSSKVFLSVMYVLSVCLIVMLFFGSDCYVCNVFVVCLLNVECMSGCL